jgi:hypothetical protein
VDAQATTHRTHGKQRAMLGNERVSHLFGVALEPMAGSPLTPGEIRGGFF